MKAFAEKMSGRYLHGSGSSAYVEKQHNGYTIYHMFDNYPDDILVMNKIIKQLIKNTEILSLVPKVFTRIFNGIWSFDGSTQDVEMIRLYKTTHADHRKKKELRKTIMQSDPNDIEIKYKVVDFGPGY